MPARPALVVALSGMALLAALAAVGVVEVWTAPAAAPRAPMQTPVLPSPANLPLAAQPQVPPPVAGGPPSSIRIGEIPDDLRARALTMPVVGASTSALTPEFYDARGERGHEALDIMAASGTPVVAVEDGVIAKLFLSQLGGVTLYQFDPGGEYAYYYAHLDHYAPGLTEGQAVKRGQVIAFVGMTGNAPVPHLHFAIFRLGPEKHWWQGEPLDPYPALTGR
ncbi:MAG: lytH [Caulobacteraceae bacterium]|nr:lytH [Caulobacteraceae bacterium]